MDKELLEKWLNGTLSEEERARFEDSGDFLKIRRILKGVHSYRSPDFDVEVELKRFNAQKAEVRKVVRINWLKPLLQTAAAILLIGLAWWLFSPKDQVSYRTAKAEKLEFYLPDSSRVILNASTFVEYNASDWANKRILTLDGEAYFEVKKGSDFVVHSGKESVRVLGTKFNVKHRENYFEVICYEGKVGVKTADYKIELKKNDYFRVIDNVKTEDKHPQTAPSWVANESSFNSVPLSEVLEEFQRQYGVDLTLRDVPTRQLFSGSFTHNDLDLALKTITLPMNIRYEIVDDQTIILTGDLD